MLIQILDQTIINVDCQAVVLYLYSDMRPPQGVTGTVDWYLNGFVSRLIQQGSIKSQFQEQVLVASQGRISQEKALLLGMGPSTQFSLSQVFPAWRQAAESLCRVRVSSLATTIPVNRSWEWSVVDTVEEMMRGLQEGVSSQGKNLRDFRLYITNFDELTTKKNKDDVRAYLKSMENVHLIGF